MLERDVFTNMTQRGKTKQDTSLGRKAGGGRKREVGYKILEQRERKDTMKTTDYEQEIELGTIAKVASQGEKATAQRVRTECSFPRHPPHPTSI